MFFYAYCITTLFIGLTWGEHQPNRYSGKFSSLTHPQRLRRESESNTEANPLSDNKDDTKSIGKQIHQHPVRPLQVGVQKVHPAHVRKSQTPPRLHNGHQLRGLPPSSLPHNQKLADLTISAPSSQNHNHPVPQRIHTGPQFLPSFGGSNQAPFGQLHGPSVQLHGPSVQHHGPTGLHHGLGGQHHGQIGHNHGHIKQHHDQVLASPPHGSGYPGLPHPHLIPQHGHVGLSHALAGSPHGFGSPLHAGFAGHSHGGLAGPPPTGIADPLHGFGGPPHPLAGPHQGHFLPPHGHVAPHHPGAHHLHQGLSNNHPHGASRPSKPRLADLAPTKHFNPNSHNVVHVSSRGLGFHYDYGVGAAPNGHKITHFQHIHGTPNLRFSNKNLPRLRHQPFIDQEAHENEDEYYEEDEEKFNDENIVSTGFGFEPNHIGVHPHGALGIGRGRATDLQHNLYNSIITSHPALIGHSPNLEPGLPLHSAFNHGLRKRLPVPHPHLLPRHIPHGHVGLVPRFPPSNALHEHRLRSHFNGPSLRPGLFPI